MTIHHKSAFTLIELSIVLVIIGLIIGGVLVGQDLIDGAEKRKLISDRERFLTAINTYRGKYNAFPGDHATAEDFFGSTNTTNGTGNNIVESPSATNDPWRFWQHLALAGFIEGSYSGDNDTGGASDATIGLNIPPTPKSGTGYTIHQWDTTTTVFGLEPFTSNLLTVGKDNPTNGFTAMGGAFFTNEMLRFDAKFDDGAANTGIIRVRDGVGGHDTTGCTSGADPNHSYNTGNTTAVCTLVFPFPLSY